MQKIEEQIELTLEQANSTWEDLMVADLKYADDIYEIISRHYDTDLELADEIIDIFCNIMNRLRDRIIRHENTLEDMATNLKELDDDIPLETVYAEDFEEDIEVYRAFEQYLTQEVKRPLSSYTINDYCSRIKILWNTFCEEKQEKQNTNNPLLQAFRNVECLRGYLERKIGEDKENRNLANAKAALNKFSEFEIYSRDKEYSYETIRK
jgi:hypothetical protein